MDGRGYGLMIFLAVSLSLASTTLYSDFLITNFVYAHDGDGDGIDDDAFVNGMEYLVENGILIV